MDISRLSKSVRRVTILQKDAQGGVSPVVVYRRSRKRKKQTAFVKPFEKLTRSLVKSSDVATGHYLKKHKKSNRKHRDGWIRDAASNTVGATAKGLKKIRVTQFLGM